MLDLISVYLNMQFLIEIIQYAILIIQYAILIEIRDVNRNYSKRDFI